jgi:hypothetical protein
MSIIRHKANATEYSTVFEQRVQRKPIQAQSARAIERGKARNPETPTIAKSITFFSKRIEIQTAECKVVWDTCDIDPIHDMGNPNKDKLCSALTAILRKMKRHVGSTKSSSYETQMDTFDLQVNISTYNRAGVNAKPEIANFAVRYKNNRESVAEGFPMLDVKIDVRRSYYDGRYAMIDQPFQLKLQLSAVDIKELIRSVDQLNTEDRPFRIF